MRFSGEVGEVMREYPVALVSAGGELGEWTQGEVAPKVRLNRD